MKGVVLGPALALLTIACSAPPAAGPTQPPSVTVPPAPTAPAAPAATAAPEDDGVIAAPTCDEQLGMAKSKPRETLEACGELVEELRGVHMGCFGHDEIDYRLDVNGSAADCYDDPISAELARRAKALDSDAARAAEKKAQDDYTRASVDFCNRYECETPVTYGLVCRAAYLGYRARQLVSLREKQLELPAGRPGSKEVNVFKPFAQKLCALPKEAWKGGRPPADCVTRALAELEGIAGRPPRCGP